MGDVLTLSHGDPGGSIQLRVLTVVTVLLLLAAAGIPGTAVSTGASKAPDGAPEVDAPVSSLAESPSKPDPRDGGLRTGSTVLDRTNVTLITGQTVTVVETTEDTKYRVDADLPMRVVETDRATYVYPAYVDFETFDRGLFNIDLLVQQGLADSESDSLPVIVETRGDAESADGSRPGHVEPLDDSVGVSKQRSLAEISAVAARVDKRETKTVARNFAQSDEVASVHLDVKYSLALDDVEDIVRVGTAREQYDVSGQGVNVSVIDSGINESHPDISGVVLDEDFTDDGTPNETEDKIGHGTHVAGIVAGDGNASNGTYVGVAPNASLFDAKVFDEGGAYTSTIVDAMGWSVDNGADVLTMSLGGDAKYERSNDPYTDAVNYAVRHDVTVVVAAGNSGSEYETMQSPGIVKNAITVGASDKTGDVTGFSSRGPTPYGKYVKPDLVAPGRNVVSACAEGSSYEDYCTGPNDAYVSLSGTSMAAPVVSGVAALLEQKHGWGPVREKNVITATAHPLGSDDVYTQGAGRVDALDALSADIVVRNATTDFGQVEGLTTASQTIELTNIGNETETLSLTVNASRISDGEGGNVSLNRSSVSLAPGESATVKLSVTTDTGNGTYSGRIQIGNNYTAIFGYNTSYVDTAVNVSGTLVTTDGTPAAGDEVYVGTSGNTDNLTDTDGNFEVDVVPENRTRLSYAQTPTRDDGSADVWLFDRVNVSSNTDLGTLEVPAAHNLTVTVVNESGAPVENATVRVTDHNASLGSNSTTLDFDTDIDGNVSGVELHQEAVIEVVPPSNGEYLDTTYVREVNVTNGTTIQVKLEEALEPPKAEVSANRTTLTAGGTVKFDASNSTDDTGIVEYRWDVDGDGSPDTITTDAKTAHTYTTAGNYTATVTVIDEDGKADTATVNITVEGTNSPPTANLTVNQTTVQAGESVTFDASDSSDDSGIAEYRWDFDADGSTDATTTSPVVTHSFATSGTYTTLVRVADAEGETDAATVDITVEQDDGRDGDTGDEGGNEDGSDRGGGGGAQGSDRSAETEVTDLADGATVWIRDPATGTHVTADLRGATTGTNLSFTRLEVEMTFDNPDFRVEFSEIRSGPSDAPPLLDGTAIAYLDIDSYGLDMRNVDEISVRFEVDKSALPEGASWSDIRMYRYHDGRWRALDTRYLGNGSYEATVPGFSEFAIGVVADDPQNTNQTVTTTSTPTQTSSTSWPSRATSATHTSPGRETTARGSAGGSLPNATDIETPGFGGVIALLAILLTGLLARRRE